MEKLQRNLIDNAKIIRFEKVLLKKAAKKFKDAQSSET